MGSIHEGTDGGLFHEQLDPHFFVPRASNAPSIKHCLKIGATAEHRGVSTLDSSRRAGRRPVRHEARCIHRRYPEIPAFQELGPTPTSA
jgi:hypothetical protein